MSSSFWDAAGERRRLRGLGRLFRDSERSLARGVPIRLTARGIWVPTPLSVLIGLLRSLRDRDFFRRDEREGGKLVVDVGTGDGRVLSALAFFEPGLEMVGIEADDRLLRQAESNLERLRRERLLSEPVRARLLGGDYRHPANGGGGLCWEDAAFVFNYPDGNELELERFFIDRASRGARLCLLTHDRELRLAHLELALVEDVPTPDASSAWHFSVYGK